MLKVLNWNICFSQTGTASAWIKMTINSNTQDK